MFTRLNETWSRQMIQRIRKNQEALAAECPWFAELPEVEQFRLAMQLGGSKKSFIQIWKILFTDNLPIVFSLAALLTAIFK